MILNEFFNLPQVFEKDMDEGTRERLSNLHDKIRKEKGLPDPKEYLKIAQQKKKEIADLKAQDKKDPGMEEGIFGSKPSPVLPIVDKIAKVASGLTPQNVEVGKQIIQNKASEITRMLSPQTKPGIDVIEQDVTEKKGDLRPKLGTARDMGKSVRKWRKNRGLDEQGVAEGKDDYVPPREANYDDKYQAMVRRVGEKAKQQEKARQQQSPKTPVRENRRELLKQIIQS